VKVNVRKFVALALFTLALSGAALAQSFEQSVRANIPFDFYANGKLQPAGTYTFAINLSAHSIQMSSDYKSSGQFLAGSPADGTSKNVGILTFRTDGDKLYVLQKAQWMDYGVSFNVKRDLARAVDMGSLTRTETVVAQLR
jgi:hypothetical protein